MGYAYVTRGGDEKVIWVLLGLGGVLRTQALVSISEYFVRMMIFDKCIHNALGALCLTRKQIISYVGGYKFGMCVRNM